MSRLGLDQPVGVEKRASDERGHRLVYDEDFADCYRRGRGRPSIPPSLLAKALLLAYREGAFESARCGHSSRSQTDRTRA